MGDFASDAIQLEGTISRRMKVKQRSVCQSCRSRKLGCDGKRPQCSQCVLTGRQCPGYPVEWSFVGSNRSIPRQKQESIVTAKKQTQPTLSPPDPGPVTRTAVEDASLSHSTSPSGGDSKCNDIVNLIIQSYMPEDELHTLCNASDEPRSRICGSWVGVLPDLSTRPRNNDILSTALDAMATSIVSQLQPDKAPNIESTQSYLTAIQTMRKQFNLVDRSCDAELLASIMCLGLAAIIFPEPSEGFSFHANAVAQILQSHGPERYQTGILHRLFVGFRPLLMIHAIQSRNPTFLALPKWKSIPFAIFSPSPMQSLLSEASMLPLLLQRMDNFVQSPVTDDALVTTDIFSAFVDVLSGLNQWESSISNNSSRVLYWLQNYEVHPPEEGSPRGPFIWFPNITMANAFTHIWAFRIICFCELERLVESRSNLRQGYSRVLGELGIDSPWHAVQTMSQQICQSMEYLLQDEMRLFGPASTVLLLQVAYEVIRMNRSAQEPIKEIIHRLDRKGLRSFAILVFERNPFLHRWNLCWAGESVAC